MVLRTLPRVDGVRRLGDHARGAHDSDTLTDAGTSGGITASGLRTSRPSQVSCLNGLHQATVARTKCVIRARFARLDGHRLSRKGPLHAWAPPASSPPTSRCSPSHRTLPFLGRPAARLPRRVDRPIRRRPPYGSRRLATSFASRGRLHRLAAATSIYDAAATELGVGPRLIPRRMNAESRRLPWTWVAAE